MPLCACVRARARCITTRKSAPCRNRLDNKERTQYLDYKFHVVFRSASVAVAYHVLYLELRRLSYVCIY